MASLLLRVQLGQRQSLLLHLTATEVMSNLETAALRVDSSENGKKGDTRMNTRILFQGILMYKEVKKSADGGYVKEGYF